jgi:hypothetical protein
VPQNFPPFFQKSQSRIQKNSFNDFLPGTINGTRTTFSHLFKRNVPLIENVPKKREEQKQEQKRRKNI